MVYWDMKRCPYCGAQYGDDIRNCPTDQELLVELPAAKAEPSAGKPRGERGYNIPALSQGQEESGWATILSPQSRFEAQIVLGRLQASGLSARLAESVVGGWLGKSTTTLVQVRVEDYEQARNLLNGE